MDKSIWDERRRGLEEGYFSKRDHEILERLKADRARDATLAEIERLTGIKDRDLLDQLLQHGVTPSTVAALSLVPLVLVAWADGDMDIDERDAVLEAAKQQGMTLQDPAYELLSRWLVDPPDAQLFSLWANHIAGLRTSLGPEVVGKLRDDVLGRARSVAKAAGGFLGLGGRVSASEERQLARLERAFNGRAPMA